MRLVLAMPPSLHRRDLRKAYAREVQLALKGKVLPYKVYKVRVAFYGKFFDKHGFPLDTAPDGGNLWKPLADEIARAAGWPRGNDKVIEVDVHYRRIQSDKALAVVELT